MLPEKAMNRLIAYLLALFLAVASVKDAQAQTASPGDGQADAGDPIAAMLDSLVTLNKVIRFNDLNGNGTGTAATSDEAVPRFGDTEYSDRMAAIVSPIPLTYNEEVRQYIDLYAYKKRALTSRVLGLADLYFPLFEEILDREKLPEELKYLAIVESALNPIARSRVGATGIWQFMYNTGKLYKLEINSYIDERRDPIRATEAACQYFKDMYGIYKDWLLVIAAYNCGAGNVNRAIVRSGGHTDFWSISRFLPRETRGYVPAFIAVTYVMKHAREHNLQAVPPVYSYFEVDTVWIDQRTSLSRIAAVTGLPGEVVQYLNPLYKRGVIPSGAGQQLVRLPRNKIAGFLAGTDRLYAPEAREEAPVLATLNVGNKAPEGYEFVYRKQWRTHRVRSGESLSVIADRYDCNVAQVRKWNKLSSTRIYPGQRLKVYAYARVKQKLPDPPGDTAKKADETRTVEASVQVADSTSVASVAADDPAGTDETPSPARQYIYHVVQQGDTLWKIANMYEGVTIQQIMELNKITEVRDLRTGTRLKVMVTG